MAMFNALINGFWACLRFPTGLVLKWLLSLSLGWVISMPFVQRAPWWLDAQKVSQPEVLWQSFWVEQAQYIQGTLPFILLLLVLWAGLNLFLSGAALSQYASVDAGEHCRFWRGGWQLLPAQLIHLAVFAMLVGMWLWFWLSRDEAMLEAFFAWGRYQAWLFVAGMVLFAYGFEVLRVQIGLEADRQRLQAQGSGISGWLRAPLIWSIGSLQGLVSLVTKPGLFLVWSMLVLLDIAVFGYARQLQHGTADWFLIVGFVQLLVIVRIQLDLLFLSCGVQYLAARKQASSAEVL